MSGETPNTLRVLAPSINVYAGPEEVRSFDFFRHCTVKTTTMFLESDFWSSIVLQVSQSEPAVKYALLALSALHERQLQNEGFPLLEDTELSGLAHYSQAVRHTNRLIAMANKDIEDKGQTEKALVAVILFVCYENARGEYQTAHMHLKNGLRILHDRRGKCHGPAWSDSSDAASLERVFASLDLQAMTYSDDSSPWIQDTTSGHAVEVPTALPVRFASFNQALHVLIDIGRSMLWLGAAFEGMKPDDREGYNNALAKTDYARAVLVRWERSFRAFKATLVARSKGEETYNNDASNVLGIWYTFVKLFIGPGFQFSEMVWDDHVADFERIVDMAASVLQSRKTARVISTSYREESFALESSGNVIVPLFYAGHHCRDPKVRRKVLVLLANLNRREGVWESRSASKMLEHIIRIEEGGLEVLTVSDIPLHRRIKYIESIEHRTGRERRLKVAYCIETKECRGKSG